MRLKYYDKTNQDYLEELTEQSELLNDYCNHLDNNKLSYAKPLATLLRVLVHQTAKSKSLFSLLEKQHLMKFSSSCKTYPYTQDIINLVTLVTPLPRAFEKNGIIETELIMVPNLDKNKDPMTWITFGQWYNGAVFIINKESNDGLVKLDQTPGSKLVISRKDIITYFANKGGGAHVDKKVESDMFYLEKSLSSMHFEDAKPQTDYKPGEHYVPGKPTPNTLHAALRQIAYEMITTINKEFGLNPTYSPTHKNLLGYDIKFTHDSCIRFDPVTREILTTD